MADLEDQEDRDVIGGVLEKWKWTYVEDDGVLDCLGVDQIHLNYHESW